MKYVQNTAIVMAAAAVILTMAGYVFSSPLFDSSLCLADGGLNSVSDICPLHSVTATHAVIPESKMTTKAVIRFNADVIPHAFGALC